MKAILFLILFIIFSCDSNSNKEESLSMYESCKNENNRIVETFNNICEGLGDTHFNKWNSSDYYCKEKYGEKRLVGQTYCETYIFGVNLANNTENPKTCEELSYFAEKEMDTTDPFCKYQYSFNNRQRCIAINDIFMNVLKTQCGENYATQHYQTWNNENYYCEKYSTDNYPEFGENSNYYIANKYCIEQIYFTAINSSDARSCDDLITHIGKEVEVEFPACFSGMEY